jgi:transcriptional regulator with XRE-family HTH domain
VSEALGLAVKERREALGLSIGDLSKVVGVSRPTVSGIENGKASPSAFLAAKMARVLGFSLDTVYGIGGTPDLDAIGLVRRDRVESLRKRAKELEDQAAALEAAGRGRCRREGGRQ